MQPDIFSQIMHAHSRHVAALFHRAFFSNAGYEAVRRGGVKAKRRPRQSNSDRFVIEEALSTPPGLSPPPGL